MERYTVWVWRMDLLRVNTFCLTILSLSFRLD